MGPSLARLLMFPVSVPNSHPPAPAMETFIKRHFQRKAQGPGEGPRRPSGVGLLTGKARRRSPAGQASSSLAQRRRSSAQLQGCLLGCGMGALGPSHRRRSSTAPPACNPRFAVEEVPTPPQPAAVVPQLLVAPLLLAGLVGTEEEEEEEGLQKEDVRAAPPSPARPGTGTPGPPPPRSALPLLPVPRWRRRRASSHLLPSDVVKDHALWGLHGHYRRLSQPRPVGQHPSPAGRRASGTAAGPGMPARVRPLSRRRQVALRRKSAGPQTWSALLA